VIKKDEIFIFIAIRTIWSPEMLFIWFIEWSLFDWYIQELYCTN